MFAERSGVGVERLNYLENGKGDPTPEELQAIQRTSGVPMWFLRAGFDGRPEPGSLEERVQRIEDQLQSLTGPDAEQQFRMLQEWADRMGRDQIGRNGRQRNPRAPAGKDRPTESGEAVA